MKRRVYRQIGGLFRSKWKAFWVFAGAILLIAAVFKSHWLILDWENASVEDPVVAPMMVNHVGLAGVLLELAIIVSLFFLRNDLARAVSLLWFAIILSLYRAWFPESEDGYCPCFGTLPEILGLSPGLASFIARTSAHIFIAGSLLIVFLELKQTVRLSSSRKSPGGKLRRPTAFLWLCLLLAGLLASSGQDLSAQGRDLELLSKPLYPIEVQGRVDRLTPNDDNPNVMETEEGIFSAIIDEGRMSAVIKILRNPMNTDPRTFHYEYRTDGEHSISFGRHDTNIVWPDDYIYPKKIDGKWKRVTNSTPRKLSFAATAIAAPTPIPHGYSGHAIPMVLGFNWSLLEPLYQQSKGPRILDYEQPQRGKYLRLICDQKANTNSLFNGLSYLSTRTRRGWTNDLFSTSGRFESDLGDGPQQLIYSSFLSSSQAKSLERTNRIQLRVELVVTNVARSEMPPLAMLDFPDVVSVFDNRFSLKTKDWIPTLGYTSTNGSIPTIERVMQQNFYEIARTQYATSARESLLRRILLGFLLLAGPLLVWGFLWKRKNRSMKERLFQWALLAGLLASSGQDLSAQGRDLELLSKPPYPIEVQGRVDRLTPNDDNPNVMETEEGIFSAIIDEGRMSAVIKILRNPWNTDIRILDYEYRTDGNHSISFGKYDTNIVWPDDYIIPKKIDGEWKRITNSTPWKPSSSGSARLSPTPIPYANVSQAIPMVLGFNWPLLESFYQNGKGPKILDFGQKMRGKLLKLTSNYRIDTNSMFNGLSYLSTSTRRGWTNDLFSASGLFESDLGTCPRQLIYSSFLSSYQVKDLGITNRTELRVEITITNVIRSENFPLAMLDFPEIVTVHDRRFSLRKSGWIPSMIYVSTNGSIPTMERVMQQDFYADALAQHAASARESLLRRILLGFLLLAGPLLVWGIVRKQSPHNY